MNTFLTYIFKHKYYSAVLSQYEKVLKSYEFAFKIWASKKSFQDRGDFQSKEFVNKGFKEIQALDRWIKSCQSLKRSQTDGYNWFLNTQKLRKESNLTYDYYKLIYNNTSTINRLQEIWSKANNLISNKRESVCRFIKHEPPYSYVDIENIAKSESTILGIDNVLNLAHDIQKKYQTAWNLFSRGRHFENIDVSELATIKEEAFSIKEQFVKLYNNKKHRKLIGLIFDDADNLYSFSEGHILCEKSCIQLLTEETTPHLDSYLDFHGDVHLEDEKELKRAIMDSCNYGIKCNFSSDFTIEEFYDYRSKFDEIELDFDDAIDKTKSNYEAIKSYNKEESGNSVVYIENYLDICIPSSSLNKYIVIYNEQKAIRDKAREIARKNPQGFTAYFDDSIDFDSCKLAIVKEIVDSENKIRTKQIEEEEKELRRQELERKRKEEERKASEIRSLRSCVSSWNTLWGGLPYNYLFPYYPTTCTFEASQEEWDNRYLVWNFKNSKGKTSPLQYENALDNLVPRIYKLLSNTFGWELTKLTLVCIPASSSENNERRFKEFSERLTRESGMGNAFSHIYVTEDATPKHLGGSGMPTLEFDVNYFRGKYVILFDDVITRGNSMLRFKQKMEQLGAVVIAGISIGRTKHERI